MRKAMVTTRIALVCVSPLQHDSRVLRHAALLADAGYDVRILAQAPLPLALPAQVSVMPGPGSDSRVRFGMVLRQAPASLLPASADLLYWLSPTRLAARRELLRFRPDIVIANDWRALPIALAAKRASGAHVIYDSHEFASEEFSDSRRWRLLARRHVARIEARHIRQADAVVTVSAGIADALAERYDLPLPLVVSNTPSWQETAFRPTGDPITVLYNGAVVPRRGLDVLIESVRLWPEGFRLMIRGPAQGGYDQHLRGLAEGLGERIVFAPAVPPDQVVSAAAEADIGIFLLSNSTTHARFAMPNKIFEYMQAGLMVISSDLPEIRQVVETASCGLLLDRDTPHSIAACLAGLDPARIDACKKAALRRARDLNFEGEGAKLLALVARMPARGLG
jgi:glycosyltransferase involved in cell wall biosynthesis